jgi:WD40 repeat protein
MIISTLTALAVSQTAPAAAPTAGFNVASTKVMQGVRAGALAAAPTGNRFAAAMEDGTIRIIDAGTRQTLRTLKGHPSQVQAMAFSPDGKWLASGDPTARIFLWNTTTWAKAHEYRPHTRAIQYLSWDRTSTRLLSTGADDFVFLFKVPDFKKELLKVAGGGAIVYSAQFFGSGNNWGVASLNQNARALAGTKPLGTMAAHDGRGMLDLAFNPAGTRAVTAGRDNRAALFDTKGFKRLGYFVGHEDWITKVVFSPNGRWVLTSSSDRTIRVWNPNTFKSVLTVGERSAVGSSLAFTGSGKYLISTDISDNISVHELSPGQAGAAAPKAPVRRKRGG